MLHRSDVHSLEYKQEKVSRQSKTIKNVVMPENATTILKNT